MEEERCKRSRSLRMRRKKVMKVEEGKVWKMLGVDR